jgi:hypothetical protein
MTSAEEDALLSDLAEAERHVRNTFLDPAWHGQIDRAYVARLLRHALQIVQSEDHEEDHTLGQSVPGVGHGDLPRRNEGDA